MLCCKQVVQYFHIIIQFLNQNILRNQIGYEGIITSDCMEMKAIDDHYTTERGCVMGLQAGLDLVMVSHTFEKQVKAIKPFSINLAL